MSWRDRTLVPVLVFLGMVVAIVSSLGAPLVPTIAVIDHVSLSSAQWSLTITFLAGAVLTPLLGRLGDGPRRRPVILGALGLVFLGSVLAALPAGFTVLLVGRALQGAGIGLTTLAIAVAHDHVPAHRARSAIALLSITTVAGVGLGYPLTGLIADQLGFHAAFWFGAVVSGLAVVLAALVIPSSAHRPARPVDFAGAALLGTALAGFLLALSEAEQWGWFSGRLWAVVVGSLALLGGWAWHELRTSYPLIDLRLLRRRTVLTADVTGVFGGVGMYLLLSLVTRYVQTPAAAGYGFDSSIVVAGFVLLPFSVGSVAASKVVPLVTRRISSDLILPLGSLIFVVSLLIFRFARTDLWEVFVVMGVAGLGVGCTFAAMPGMIVRSVPGNETGSAIGFNQVLRTIGYSVGSALSATVLDIYTDAPSMLPTDSGYGAAATLGIGVWALTAVISFLLPGRRSRRSAPTDELLVEESVDSSASGVPLYDASRAG